jgi:hypothetical protein
MAVPLQTQHTYHQQLLPPLLLLLLLLLMFMLLLLCVLAAHAVAFTHRSQYFPDPNGQQKMEIVNSTIFRVIRRSSTE